MTTHDLAKLLDHLREGFAHGLTSSATKELIEASEAIRELPDIPLKAFSKEIKSKPPKSGSKKGRPPVDLPALIERIRTVQGGSGSAELVLAEIEQLTATQMKAIIQAFNQKVTKSRDGNLVRIRALLQNGNSTGETSSGAPRIDPALVESGVLLYQRLRDTRGISIQDIRSQFDPIRFYPKPVVEEISRRLGYTPDGSRETIAKRLLSNLESFKINELRGDLILSGT